MCNYKQTGICFYAAVMIRQARVDLTDSLDELAAAGEDAAKAGRYPEAIRLYEKIVAEGKTYETSCSSSSSWVGRITW